MGQLLLHAGQLGSFLCCWGVLFAISFYNGFFCASEYLSAELAFLKPSKSYCSIVSEGLACLGEFLAGLPHPRIQQASALSLGKVLLPFGVSLGSPTLALHLVSSSVKLIEIESNSYTSRSPRGGL